MNDHDISGPDHTPSSEAPEQSSVSQARYTALTPGALSAVTDELVLRLNQRLNQASNSATRVATPPPSQEIDAFAKALIAPSADVSRAVFDSLLARGKTPDSLSLDYIAAAARRLGEWWVADSCSFLDVTVGTSRLHILQRGLRSDFAPIGPRRHERQSALFAPVPGDSHALGVSIAADFFIRAGWHVDLCNCDSIDALCDRVRRDHYDLIGLSAGCTAITETTKRTVHCIRAVRPDARIALGGHLTELEPDLVQALNVETATADITSAPFLLQTPGSLAINH